MDIEMQKSGWLVIIVCIIAAINAAAFTAFGVDKYKAKRRRWRIPEATLLGFAVFGGSLGAWIGMYFFHHKTQKPKFFLGVPIILMLQIALICVIYWSRS